MRTTVNIDDALLQQAKQLAARRRTSLGQVVDDALRTILAERPAATEPVELPRSGGSGLQPGVDLEDKDALAAILGDNQPSHAAG